MTHSSRIVNRLLGEDEDGDEIDLDAACKEHLAYLRSRVPPPGATFAQIARFVSSIDWNALIADDEGSGSYFLTDGSSGVACTGYANVIRELFGPERAIVYGFMTWDNPTSKIGRDCEGHDFAVVDGRYIVDPWAAEVETYDRVGVFDMKNKQMMRRVRILYGDSSSWKVGPASED